MLHTTLMSFLQTLLRINSFLIIKALNYNEENFGHEILYKLH